MTRDFGFSILDRYSFYLKGRRIEAPITVFKQVLQHPKYPHLVAALNYADVLTIHNALLINPEKYYHQNYPESIECVSHIKWAETKPYLLMWCFTNFRYKYLSILDCSDELEPSRSNSTYYLDEYTYQFKPIIHTGKSIQIGAETYPCPIEKERMKKIAHISQMLEKRAIKTMLTKYIVADLANIIIHLT